jgi:hypothetical protein
MKKTPLKKNMQQNCDVRKDKLLLLERKKKTFYGSRVWQKIPSA